MRSKTANFTRLAGQKGSFKLLVAPYSETLTISALSSPTTNRGLQDVERLPTLLTRFPFTILSTTA